MEPSSSLDTVSREQLVAVVLKLKDRQKELVAHCRKAEEEKGTLKTALKKVRDEATSKLSKAKSAMERMPRMEAEINRLRSLQSTPAATHSCPVSTSPPTPTELAQRIARLPQPVVPQKLLEEAQQATNDAHAPMLPQVCSAVLTLRSELLLLPQSQIASVPEPEPVVEEEDDISAWLSAQASEHQGAQTDRRELNTVPNTNGPVLAAEMEALLVAVASHINQLNDTAATNAAEHFAMHAAIAVHQSEKAASEELERQSANSVQALQDRLQQAEAALLAAQAAAVGSAAVLAQSTSNAVLAQKEKAEQALREALATAERMHSQQSEAMNQTIEHLGTKLATFEASAQARVERQMAVAETDNMKDLEVAAKIAELNEQLALKDHQTLTHQAEMNQKLLLQGQEATQKYNMLNAELVDLKKEMSTKDQLSLDYHNALRKLGESAQYSEGRVNELNKELDRTKQQLMAEQQGSKQGHSQVADLKHLANMDIQLLIECAAEDRREDSCEVSRLRCELCETVARASTNELDVNEKLAVQRNKLQEFRCRSKALMDEKDAEVGQLVVKIQELQEDIKSGRPLERGILEIAREQAGNANQNIMLKAEIVKKEAELDGRMTQMQEFRQRESLLKAQVRELTDTLSRNETVDMEYIKNVIVKYMECHGSDDQQKMLLPMISNMLHFTADDLRRIHNVFAEAAKSSSYVPGLDAVNPFSYMPSLR